MACEITPESYIKTIIDYVKKDQSGQLYGKTVLKIIEHYEDTISALLQQIERTVDEQLPTVPQDVIAAMKNLTEGWAKQGASIDDMYRHFLNPFTLISTGDHLIVREFAASRPLDYIKAISIGYTIEEPEKTTEQKIEERLTELCIEHNVYSSIPLPELARKLTLVTREVFAEDRDNEEATL